MRRQITLAVVFMDYKCRINGIIRRARRVKMPLGDLCAVAKVNKSTLYRWRQDDANPRLRSMFRALDAMETVIAEREQALISELSGGSGS